MLRITVSFIVALLAVLLLASCAGVTSQSTPTPGFTLPAISQIAVPPPSSTHTAVPLPSSTHTAAPTLSSTPPPDTLPSTPAHDVPSATSAQPLRGPYLGQEPPGMQPKLFAPGVVSNPDSNEFSGSFSPDGSEYYFYRFSDDSPARLLFSRLEDDQWTPPEEPGFSAGMTAYEPYVTADNQRLYFATVDYPAPLEHPAGLPVYVFVTRTPNGWTEPQYAGQGMFISSSLDGQLYTTDMSSRNRGGQTYLAKVTVIDGSFTEYERLPIEAHWGSQAHPCIAPDESYIIFDVEEGRHLFVSFKKADGSWGEAIDLTQHGFDPQAGGPYISPDGKYLFFALHGDIWWVDIRVIEGLHPVE